MFVEAFYTYNLTINIPEREIYDSTRIRLAKHPNEELSALSARILTFLHAYNPDLTISNGLFDPGVALIKQVDITGELLRWISLGTVEIEILKKALKKNPSAKFSVYFDQPGQIDSFCHGLRGSTENWVKDVTFYQLDQLLIEKITSITKSSNNLTATIMDEAIFLTFQNSEYVGQISKLNIWNYYQVNTGNSNTIS